MKKQIKGKTIYGWSWSAARRCISESQIERSAFTKREERNPHHFPKVHMEMEGKVRCIQSTNPHFLLRIIIPNRFREVMETKDYILSAFDHHAHFPQRKPSEESTSLMQDQHVGASVEGTRESAGDEEEDVTQEQVHATE